MKYLNTLILIALSVIYLSLSSQIKFSTNFIEIFFSQKSLHLFSTAKKFGLTDEILISKKGFNDIDLEKLNNIADKMRDLPEISKVDVTFEVSSKMKEYLKQNYYKLADFNSTQITEDGVYKKLQNIHEKIYNSVFYEPINTYDPLELFSIDFTQNERYLKLKDYGYIIKAKTNVDTSNAKSARVVYDKVHEVLKEYPDTIVFAPFFYLVENSTYIRNDAQIIMLVSSIFLLILYFFILKNYKLFFNTIMAIASSILSAILVTFFVFKSISILAVVFGISVTAISIDYMFHYYFHGDFTKKRLLLNKRVFYGFVTTIGVFVIFSFISIELFAQLAIFSVVSLSVAYSIFSWVFFYLDIPLPKVKQISKKDSGFKPLHVVIVSLVLLGFAYENLEFDNNLKNLDYQNTKLTQISKRFQESLGNDKYKGVIIKANSKEVLLQKYEKISKNYPDMLGIGKFVFSKSKCEQKQKELKKFDFKKIKTYIDKHSSQIGFNDTFANSYNYIERIDCNMEVLDDMKFKIIEDADTFYTMALIKKELIKANDLYEVVDLAKSLSEDTKSMKSILVNFMFFSILFIVVILFLTAGFEILFPLTYLLFPLSVVLFTISLIGDINIMHIFALVILIAISIDYGIYLHKTDTQTETKLAIKYALMSTFFGFGVLIFSSTVALHSIGLVITVGIGSIFFLLYGKMIFFKFRR